MKITVKLSLWGIFALLAITFGWIYLTDKYILTVGFYENSGHPVSGNPAEENFIYASMQKWIYLSAAICLFLKLFSVTLILYTALYLSDQPVRFEKLLLVAVLSEFVFMIPAALKLFWFHYNYPQGTLTEWQRTYIFSALSLFNDVPADWCYALQTLNLFEVGYWFLLAYGIRLVTGSSFDRALRTVVSAYVPALFVWVALVTFVSLVLFPHTG